MLKNKTINLGIIKKVSRALGELNTQVAYVGGATVSIYADDPAADDVRPTKDVDIVVHIANFGELNALQEKLGQKGIQVDPTAHITCRFYYEDVIIDVMATKQVGWAPSNEWFESGFKNLIPFEVDNETTIQIFPFPYFLATKFSAFVDRGGDPRSSKDFEDIVYVLDNRLGLVKEILTAPEEVRSYIAFQFHELQHADNVEAIQAHLNPFTVADRYVIIQDKIKQVINGT
jgi:predicted nucleotidyltransferase